MMQTFYVQRIETKQIWELGQHLIRLSMEADIEKRAQQQGYVLMPVNTEEIVWMRFDHENGKWLSADEKNATHVRVTVEREGYPDDRPPELMCVECGEEEAYPNWDTCWGCAFT